MIGTRAQPYSYALLMRQMHYPAHNVSEANRTRIWDQPCLSDRMPAQPDPSAIRNTMATSMKP
jgi:hypothetical protein